MGCQYTGYAHYGVKLCRNVNVLVLMVIIITPQVDLCKIMLKDSFRGKL